ncbi:MAG: hypothetical protein AAFU73_11940 [Planctomycetota bacterium]
MTDDEIAALRARVRPVFERFEVGATRPLYLLLDPATEEVLARFNGAPILGEQQSFAEFLETWVKL